MKLIFYIVIQWRIQGGAPGAHYGPKFSYFGGPPGGPPTGNPGSASVIKKKWHLIKPIDKLSLAFGNSTHYVSRKGPDSLVQIVIRLSFFNEVAYFHKSVSRILSTGGRGFAWQGACMAGGGACMAGGACVAGGMCGGGHAWQGGMHGKGACVVWWQRGAHFWSPTNY